MSDSIGSLLGQRELFEPPEIKCIKDFVFAKFGVTPGVKILDDQIMILVPGAGLAGALRPLMPQLQEACETQKRITIRIHR